MKAFLFLLCISLMSLPARAHEQSFYIGGAYSVGRFQQEGISTDDDKMSGSELRFGYYFNERISIEARAGKGFDSVSFMSDEARTRLTMQKYQGIFIKPGLRMDRSLFFMLIGYYEADLKTEFLHESRTINRKEQGVSLGLGFGAWHSERLAMSFEWRELIESTQYKWLGATFAIMWAF